MANLFEKQKKILTTEAKDAPKAKAEDVMKKATEEKKKEEEKTVRKESVKVQETTEKAEEKKPDVKAENKTKNKSFSITMDDLSGFGTFVGGQKMSQVLCSVTPEMKDAIQKAASESGQSVSRVIALCIYAAMKRGRL